MPYPGAGAHGTNRIISATVSTSENPSHGNTELFYPPKMWKRSLFSPFPFSSGEKKIRKWCCCTEARAGGGWQGWKMLPSASSGDGPRDSFSACCCCTARPGRNGTVLAAVASASRLRLSIFVLVYFKKILRLLTVFLSSFSSNFSRRILRNVFLKKLFWVKSRKVRVVLVKP